MNEIGKPFNIICIKQYEFEGRIFKLGEIGLHSWGRNIPEGWRKATQEDMDDYINPKKES